MVFVSNWPIMQPVRQHGPCAAGGQYERTGSNLHKTGPEEELWSDSEARIMFPISKSWTNSLKNGGTRRKWITLRTVGLLRKTYCAKRQCFHP